ncbi:MAG: hypothetical protein HY675_22595 [Chloroflexi bacterium]|nr:hypothetical protein [Chloroflexota bacterium]
MATAQQAFLSRIEGQFWRVSTKDIIGSVLMGIALNLVQQVTERADAALTGGSFIIFGSISYMTIFTIAAIYFRYPGALITGLVQAGISVATAASPMSPAFVWTNIIQSFAAVLIVWRLSLRPWWHWPVLTFGHGLVGSICIAIGLWLILQLPANVILLSASVTWVIESAVSAPLVAVIARGIDRSGVLD